MRQEQRSAQAAQYRRLYNTSQWKALRANQLSAKPLCEWCERQGKITAATIADHVTPHKGDERLFFNPDNLASLCKPHHDGAKQGDERRGFSGRCDANGWPTDPAHPANLS